jgi:hypothetical protein
LVLPGVAGQTASAPDSAALSITGDIDVKMLVSLPTYPQANAHYLAKRTSSPASGGYRITQGASSALTFQWAETTVQDRFENSTVAPTVTANTPIWFRVTLDVDNGAGQYEVKFYTSADGTNWTQLGTTITGTSGPTAIVDGTSGLFIGARNDGTFTMTGTVQRVIIQNAYDTADNTSDVVFDANFATATADALAFTESSTNAATVSVVTTRYSYGLPNVQWSTSNATQALTADRVYYQPFLISAPTTVDMTSFRVTTGPASAANVRTGIYAADANMQPTGAPILDSGNVAVATSATGNFYTSVTPVTLQPGMYLTAINTSVGLTCQAARGGLAGADIGNGANAIFNTMLGTQTQGAFPNPPTAWNTRAFAATAPNHTLFLRWSAA